MRGTGRSDRGGNANHGDDAVMTASPFWHRVETRGHRGCWVWNGPRGALSERALETDHFDFALPRCGVDSITTRADADYHDERSNPNTWAGTSPNRANPTTAPHTSKATLPTSTALASPARYAHT